MCEHVLLCVKYVLSSLCCWLPSVRWLLCGDDGSKKTKTKSVIPQKYFRERNSCIKLQSFQIFLFEKISTTHICNYFRANGIHTIRLHKRKDETSSFQLHTMFKLYQGFEGNWQAHTTQKGSPLMFLLHFSHHIPLPGCLSRSTVRERLCCCDTASRELLQHCEHSEGSFLPGTQNTVNEENPANLSSPCTHPSFLGMEGPLTSGSLVPPAQPPNLPGKESSLHLTNSAQRLQLRDFRRRARMRCHRFPQCSRRSWYITALPPFWRCLLPRGSPVASRQGFAAYPLSLQEVRHVALCRCSRRRNASWRSSGRPMGINIRNSRASVSKNAARRTHTKLCGSRVHCLIVHSVPCR